MYSCAGRLLEPLPSANTPRKFRQAPLATPLRRGPLLSRAAGVEECSFRLRCQSAEGTFKEQMPTTDRPINQGKNSLRRGRTAAACPQASACRRPPAVSATTASEAPAGRVPSAAPAARAGLTPAPVPSRANRWARSARLRPSIGLPRLAGIAELLEEFPEAAEDRAPA